MADLVLVIDRGTTIVKASLFDRNLDQVAVASAKNPAVKVPAAGWAEADIEDLWQTVCAAVRQLWTDGNDPGLVRAVIVAGQGNGLILLDGEGRPVRNGILSLDSRANGIVEGWKADCRYARAAETLRFPFGPPAPLPLLAWLDQNEPETLRAARQLIFSKDWTRFKLTGKIATDLTDASGAGLIEAASASYANDVFDLLGLAHIGPLMPPLLPSAAQAGDITAAAADATGLPAGLPVFTGSHDVCACHNGLATLSPGAVAIIFGTWAIDLFLLPEGAVAPVMISHPEPGRFLSGAGDGNAGAVLDMMIGVLYNTEQARVPDYYQQMEAEAASAPPSHLLFVPHLFGHALDGAATGGFLGLDARTTRAGLIRAVYEGIILSNCAYLASFPNFDGLEEVWLAGGGAKSAVLGQILADTLGRPVHVARDSELVGRGAAISAMIGLGDLARVTDAPKPAIARSFAPNPAFRDYYLQKLAILGELMTSEAPLARKLAALSLPPVMKGNADENR